MNISLYHKIIGAITGRMEIGPDLVAFYDNEEQGWVEGNFVDEEGRSNYWVDPEDQEVYEREPIESDPTYEPLVEITSDVIVFSSGLPEGAWVRIRPTGAMDFMEEAKQADENGDIHFAPKVSGVYSLECVGQYRSDEWEIEAITIETLQYRQCDLVDAFKFANLDNGVQYADTVWDIDKASQDTIRSYLGIVLPSGFYYTDRNNNQVSMTSDDMLGLAQTIAAFSFANHDHAQNLKTAIRSASTIASIMQIDVKNGWPV